MNFTVDQEKSILLSLSVNYFRSSMRKFILGLLCVPLSLFGWSSPISVYTYEAITMPSIAMDDQGNVVTAFEARNISGGPSFEIGAQIIENHVTNLHQFPLFDSGAERLDIARVNPAGNALLHWQDQDYSTPTPTSYISAAFLIDGVWGPVTSINGDTEIEFQFADIFIDQLNRGTTLWFYTDSQDHSRKLVVSRCFSSSWAISRVLDNNYAFSSRKLVGTPSGQLLVAWKSPSSQNINTSYFDGIAWSDAAFSNNTIIFSQVVPAINASNQGLILWNNAADGVSGVTFDNGTYGLENTIYTALTDENVSEITLKINSSGNAIALLKINAPNDTTLYKAMLYTNQTWGTPFTIATATDGVNYISSTDIGLDNNGNAYVVWTELDSLFTTSSVFVRHYDAESHSWENTEQVSENGVFTSNSSIAVNDNGNAAISWIKFENNLATAQIILNRSFLSPPQNFIGVQMKNVFLQQTLTLNRLSWTPPTDDSVIGYFIYRNDLLIATILDKEINTYDDNMLTSDSVTYKICSFDENGATSTFLELILGT